MPILIEHSEDSVLTLTLNRPDKRNALNAELVSALTKALSAATSDVALRAIVITGAGRDFCSGADLSSLQKISQGSYADNLEDARRLADLFLLIRKVSVPVIAAVHGRALAGGCGLATACDIVLASRSARFGYPEVKIGFVPAIVTAFLRRTVSEKVAFELVTRGDEFSAETASKIGLVNQIFDDETFPDTVRAYVQAYRSVSRSAVALSKALVYEIDGKPLDDAVARACEVNAEARMTDDCKAGVAKFLSSKR